jgi:hypothetical protein
MNLQSYLIVSGGVYGVVALTHLFRLLNDVAVRIGGADLPMWMSWLGFGVTAALALWALELALQK